MLLVEIGRINKEEVAITTSLDIAETFDKEHFNVLRDIRELKCSDKFKAFNFEGSTYIDLRNKKQPMYYVTRDGFTLLVMGYIGEKAMAFKEAYISQFNAMERIITGKREERVKGIAVRQSLTKAIQLSGENERMHGHAYSTYTNCIYKILFGMNANQLREKFGISRKENLRDYFTEEELRAVQSMECMASGMVDCGMGYDEIKKFITEHNTKKLLL